MSQQDENRVLTPQELREALLSELEVNRQELEELSNEQLAEIVGGLSLTGKPNSCVVWQDLPQEVPLEPSPVIKLVV